MMKPAKVTRADVAIAAEVSPATVTYSLDPSPKVRISEETVRRVRRIAAEKGYHPNHAYRAISAGRTFMLGLVLPQSRSMLFPFYELIIDGLLSAMHAADYDLLFLTRLSWERVGKLAQQRRIDGLVILQSDWDEQWIRRAVATDLPVVVANRDLPAGLDGCRAACVYSDHVQMMEDVVAELVAAGCRRLLNFSDSGPTFANRAAADAFNAAIARQTANGVLGSTIAPVWEHFAPQADAVFAPGHLWDGIFVNGRRCADELLRSAAAHGLRAGDDFQLISTDAFPETEDYAGAEPCPRREHAAVYWQQPRLVGQEAWKLMAALLAGPGPWPREVRVPYLREQTAASRQQLPLAAGSE